MSKAIAVAIPVAVTLIVVAIASRFSGASKLLYGAP